MDEFCDMSYRTFVEIMKRQLKKVWPKNVFDGYDWNPGDMVERQTF